jgi:hypothetical protein
MKPSIAKALDETHPTGPDLNPGGYGVGRFGASPGDDDIGADIGHSEAKLDLPKQAPSKFPPFDFPPPVDLHEQHQIAEMALQQQQGEPTAFTGQQQTVSDAMLYGVGFTRIASGNEGVEVTNVPADEVLSHGEDLLPGGMGNDIRETRLPVQDVLVSHLAFGDAIRAMETGLKVQREGWNGKGMWIALSGLEGAREVQAADLWSVHARIHAREQGGSAKVLPCIIMKTATGEILMGWLASQSDMLAKDWRIVS